MSGATGWQIRHTDASFDPWVASNLDTGETVFGRDRAEVLTQAIEAFRAAFIHAKAWGLRLTATLPAMSGLEAEKARADAGRHYWDHEWGTYHMQGLYRAELAAIDAATIKPGGKVRTSSHLRRLIAERDGDDCWLCARPMGDDCTLEHKQARSLGGTNALDNLALCHAECNRKLGALPLAAKEAIRADVVGRDDGEVVNA